ncbi:acyltransferase [Tardiphaga sp.]|uniref:acyltransferase family protein n=1 Tax=Tardiphaga sp. TaxID=1926292 RepID=UPI0026228C26|nr:acyltransferase [Tardiphaga sp.]
MFANSLRGVAALSVVVSHYFGVFWGDRVFVGKIGGFPPADEPTPSVVLLLDSLPSVNAGVLGVALFFLISGFVIPFSLQKMDVAGFIVNRLLRIVPTYAAGFAVTLTAIWWSSRYYGFEFPYQKWQVILHFVPGLRDSIGFPNIDGIIWTLEIEVKFYIIAATMASLLRNGDLRVFLFPLALFAAVVIDGELRPGSTDSNHLLWQFRYQSPFLIFMFIGVAFNYSYRKKFLLPSFVCLAAALFCGFYISAGYLTRGCFTFLTGSYLTALLIFVLASRVSDRWIDNAVLRLLAAISYPLYVCHAVAGYVVLAALLRSGIPAYLALLLTCAAAVAVSLLIHHLIEVPTQHVDIRRLRRFFPAVRDATRARR